MPATTFPEHARAIEDGLHSVVTAGEAVLLTIQIDQRSALRGFISGSLQFGDGPRLHFREFVDTSLVEPRLMYAYHYEADGELRFRYDNAAHRPPLTQAEHKHTPVGTQFSPPPSLDQVLSEILSLIYH